MKKSFMTRVLAMGLSFAMAFSLSAATNVTTASAAAKKVGVTTMMRVPTKSVTEGKSVSTYMNDTALEKYRIKKVAKLSAVADKYIDVDVITKGKKPRQGIKITAHEGAVTAAKLTKKGVYVTIYFAETTSAKKAAKATAKKYAKLKVAVQAKPVEKTTMTAAATAVKEITLTFSKAVADTAAAKVAVKKGNATPTFTVKWADDAKSATLAMDSKMSAGTFDITVSGVEKEDLTASVTVEDQKLTSFELVSANLVANAVPVSYGSVKFKALDQYGKPMRADNVTVTSSFGKTGTYSSSGAFTAATNYQMNVKDSEPAEAVFEITSALAVLGQKGTITIVSNNGVSLTSEVTLVEAAQAAKVENLGLYNTNKGKFMDMTAGDKATDYVIALKFTDQYDSAIKASAVANIEATLSAGTTSIKVGSLTSDVMKINDEDVYVLKLDHTSGATEVKAGTMQVTVVNTRRSLLDTLSFTVLPGTVIKSFSVSADDDIYGTEEATLSYTAIDADGKEVTSYDVLNKAMTFTPDGGSVLAFKKQKDGSAKLVYTPVEVANPDEKTCKAYDNRVLTFTLYSGQANTLVINKSVKVNQSRKIWEITGLDSKAPVATVTGVAIYLKPTQFKMADQYGNTLTKDQIKATWANDSIVATTDSSWTVAERTGYDTNFAITPVTGDSVKIKFAAKKLGDYQDDGYTVTFTVVDAAKATDFVIEWADGLNVFSVSDAALTLNKGDEFEVYGKVAGKKVLIPDAQVVVISGSTQDQVKVDPTKDRITKEGTLKLAVDDADHNTNIIEATYTYSNAKPELAKIKTKDTITNVTGASATAITISDIVDAAFDLTDQYGDPIDPPTGLVANITISGVNGKGVVKYNDSNQACVYENEKEENIKEITVVLTCGELTAKATITVD